MKNHKETEQRCIYSNKIVKGKEVIIKDYAQDYVLKQAFFMTLEETQ